MAILFRFRWLILCRADEVFIRLNSYVGPAFGRILKKLLLVFILISQSLHCLAQLCGTPGLDGSGNITGSINTYFPVAGDITLTAGSKTLKLAAVPPNDSYGNSFGTKPISAGDMLLIIQMQDASINSSNDNRYGSNNSASGPDNLGGTGFTDLGNSGVFEYAIATNAVPLSGGDVTFKGAGTGKGTVNSYYNAAETASRGKRTFQVVRVPQYSNLILSSDIKTPPFNGIAGGIIAFDVSGSMDFNNFTIDASARGFRGGYGPVGNSGGNITDVYMVPSTDTRSVGKGEGIAGTPRYMWDGFNQVVNPTEGLPGGSYGKGAPGNAGGGGNDHNAGGGGGGNGGQGGVGGDGTYTVGGSPNTFPNGGRPGSTTYTTLNPDITRMIMGGGGGGGDANNALNGVKGGVGGGIILINVGRIIGNGVILANGGDGAAGAQGNQPDGAGGGGAGGTVYIKVTNPDPAAVLTVEAKGGNGGNTRNDVGTNEHGPGGGGGGGLVLFAMSPGNVNVNVNKGLAGKANSGGGTTHGAADGTDGKSLPYLISDLPAYLQGGGSGCYPQLTTILSEVTPAIFKYPGSEVVYIIKATNYPNGGNAGGVHIEAQLPPGISFKSATVTYTGDSGGPVIISNLGTSSKPLFGDFNISPGDDVIITIKAEVDCGTMPSTYNAGAQSLYLDPSRTISDPNRRITSVVNAFPGSKTNYETGSLGAVPGANFDGDNSVNDDVIVKTASPLTNNAISIAGDPVKFCVNTIGDLVDPAVIVGTIPSGDTGFYTYQWQSSSDNVNFIDIASATSKDFDPPSISVTTFYRRTVSSSACVPSLKSNVIKVLVTVVPVADFETPEFCLNDGTATFTNKSSIADGTESQLTYIWDFGDPGSGSSNTSAQTNGSHVYSSQRVYNITLTVTSKDGCKATKVQSFTVNGSIPKADFTVKNSTELCSVNPVEFVDEAKVDFGEVTRIEWYYDFINNPAEVEIDDNPGLRASPKAYSHKYPTFNAPVSKTYEVRMKVFSGATCVDETVQTIIVNAVPEIEFTSISSTCMEEPAFQLTQATEKFGVPGLGTYSGAGVTSDGLFNPSLAGPGKHTITYTYVSDAGNCTDSKSQDISVHANPVTRVENVEILLGGEIVLPSIAAETGLIYQWSPSSFLSKADILNPVASPEETTTYILTVTDIVTGCINKGSVKVLVNKMPEVPNTFSPNGDGINDFWVIENLETYTNVTVTVFNRNGEKVFSSNGYASPWDGTYKGSQLATGTYYYLIDPKKGRNKLSGSITILR